MTSGLALVLALAGGPALSPEVEAAMTGWTVCQGQAQLVLASRTEGAEHVAAAVMQQCEPEQLALLAALELRHGRRPQSYVADLRETFRVAGIRKVRELRAAGAWGEPIQAWNRCIGIHSIEKSAAEPAEQTAERALASCIAQEDALVAEAERKLGPDNGPGVRSRFRSDAREGIIALIASCRADPAARSRGECAPNR